MGVMVDTIILFGYEMDFEEYKEAGGYEEFSNMRYRDGEEGELVTVSDGRGGEYFYVGYLVGLKKQRDGMRFNERYRLCEETYEKYENKEGLELFMEDYEFNSKGEDPCFHVFTHCH